MAVYLDYNATTPMLPSVIQAMNRTWEEAWANPNSSYRAAQAARSLLEDTRGQLATLLGLKKSSEVLWTSGGSEANSTVLWGVVRHARLNKNARNRVIISQAEHSSVLKVARVLKEELGVDVIEVPLTPAGHPDMDVFRSVLDSNTLLVSMMAANNETGVIFPLQEIATLCKTTGALFHTDSINAFAKMPLTDLQYPDFISLSGHKIYGPKGCGVLVCRSGNFLPMIYGGGQERNRRSGTENVAAAVGFVTALEANLEQHATKLAAMGTLRDLFEARIKHAGGCEIVGVQSARVANTSLVMFEGVEAQALMMNLDLEDIFMSTGSACASGSITPSHVLTSMGYPKEKARSAIRMSVGLMTTREEVEHAAERVVFYVNKLRSLEKLNLRGGPDASAS